MRSDLITVDKEIMGGTPVFKGTRVPVQSLFDYLTHGHPLEEFLGDFPGVSRETALMVLDLAGRSFVGAAHETAAG